VAPRGEAVRELGGVLEQAALRRALHDGDAEHTGNRKDGIRCPGMPPPRIVAITPGDPDDPATFSGTSHRLLTALRDRGALVGAVSGRPKALVRVEQAASFDRDRTRWQQWYNAGASPLSPAIRAAMGALATRRARGIDADAWLQLGGWYRPVPPAPLVRAFFDDGNIATFFDRPDLAIDRGAGRIRRAFAHEQRLYDEMDVILPMSEWLGRSFVDDFGQDPAKVIAVGGGPNFFDRLPEVPDRVWDRPRVLFVGKNWERKGGPAVLTAFAKLHEHRPDAELTIIGPKRLPSDRNDGVRFLGPLDPHDPRLSEAFEQATTFVMPSLYEPFGLAFLEAMAYGLPSIGGDTCAMPEIIADRKTGFLVAPNDHDALAECLIALATDPAKAQAMGAAGRMRMQTRYTWDAVAGRIVDEIAARVKDHGARPTT
jgi:glycosyltransferase involved in cell wall biosynthesis